MLEKRLSSAALRLEGQKMFQILARAKELEREGKEILHFELGDPDFDTPPNIVEAGVHAIKEGHTHYSSSAGLLELRETAAEVTMRSRHFRPKINQLLVCPGANIMIYYAARCVLEPGDEVIVPDPGFVSYFSILNLLQASIVRVPLRESNQFQLSPEDVEQRVTPRTRMIIINSPSNPTGAVLGKNQVKQLYEIAEKHNLYILSDEIYARMIYSDSGVSHHSPSVYDNCEERTILVNGFSKSYAMTGWRLGVVTGPVDVIEKMSLLQETLLSCVPPFVQYAGVEALKGDQAQIYSMIAEYQKRRDAIVEGLNSLPGVSCLKPKGAFYAFPNITGTNMGSDEFSQLMLNVAGVAMSPGPVFGEFAEGYVRLCYVNSMDNIKKAIDKMRQVLTVT